MWLHTTRQGMAQAGELSITLEQPSRGGRVTQTGLPADVQSLSCRRLGLAALIYAVVYVVDYTVHRLAPKPVLDPAAFSMIDLAAAVSIPMAFGMFLVVRFGRMEARKLMTLGLVFEVLAALGVAIQEHWAPWDPDATVRGISWLCVWIVSFPVLVPSTVKRTLTASLAAAATGPLSLYIAVWVRGNPIPHFGVLVDLFEPLLLCAVLAPVLSQIVYRLGRALGAARKFGSYELVEKLGSGGMGEVWLARHQMLARPAAIKLIRPDVLGPPATNPTSLERRFEREAQAIAQLESPHTIQLYDFGVSESGRFFYVMELLDGLDLDLLITQHGPVPPERAISLLLQICHSLRDAHGRGLIHRDIKPANLYVCRKGSDYDFVKVLDFGLVKSLRGDGAVETTRGQLVAGTPGFLAPEHARSPERIDQRTDLYSLACVAFWLLTGELVFDVDSPLMMLACHLQDTPQPPSRRSPHDVPEELDALILRCLAKDPDDRPSGVDEVTAALRACPGYGAWTSEEAARWWAAHESERVSPTLRPVATEPAVGPRPRRPEAYFG